MACGEHLSGDSELSSPSCWGPNRPPGGTIFTVFGGDLFVDMLCSTKIVVNYYRFEIRYRIDRSMDEYIAGCSDLWGNEGLLIFYSVVTICCVSLHL